MSNPSTAVASNAPNFYWYISNGVFTVEEVKATFIPEKPKSTKPRKGRLIGGVPIQ